MTPRIRNNDGNQVVVSGGVSYSDHQELRDLVLELKGDVSHITAVMNKLDNYVVTARVEWTGREGLILERVTNLEREPDRAKGEAIGITRSAAFISAVFTLIGMFLAIAVSLVVK